jgi:hypothetical protein
MTQKEVAPYARRPATTAVSPTPSTCSFTSSDDARAGKPCPGGPNPDPKSSCSAKLSFCALLKQRVQSAWRRMSTLLGSTPSERSLESPYKSPVLMCFSRLEGHWYCVFFEEGALHKRLPRRLTYRDVAKVYETARRGHAQLEDLTARQDFESALASGRGKIWLHLTCEQRTALRQTVAA